MLNMNVRVIAASLFAVVGMTGVAGAQYYPPPPPGYGQPRYAPPPGYVPPPGYTPPPGYVPAPGYAPPPGYRGGPVVDDDDDVAALPAPGPYGRPSGYTYDGAPRPPSGIQQDALPAPGAINPP